MPDVTSFLANAPFPVRSVRAAYRSPIRGLLLTLCLGSLGLVPSHAQDPAAARLFAEAERLARARDSRAALEEYELLVRQFPSDQLAPKVLLNIAELHRLTGNDRSAADALERLLETHPRSPEAASAFLAQAELRSESARSYGELEEARAVFRRVPLLFGTETFPVLDARSRARLRGAELDLLLGDLDGARAELVAIIEDEPASTHTGQARLMLGQLLLELGETAAGLEILQRLADEGPVDGDRPSGAARSAQGTSSAAASTVTSTAAERGRARRLVSLAHRHLLRPSTGQRPWKRLERFPDGAALRGPEGVAAAEDGRVTIVDPKQPLVLLADASGRVLDRRELRDGARPGWSGSVPHVLTDEEIVLPFDGQRMGFLEPRPGRESPLDDLRAAARDVYGDWFVAAKGWKGVLVYESRRQGQELLAVLQLDLVDLDRDSLGRIYLLDRKAGRVLRSGADRRSQEVLVQADWKRAEALAVDSLGSIYVLDRGERQVLVYDRQGRVRHRVGPNLDGGVELRDPRDISVDGSGRLFIADTKLPFVVLLD